MATTTIATQQPLQANNKLLSSFLRDITYLQQDMVPMKTSGEQVHKLDYEGSPSQGWALEDHHVLQLTQALAGNSRFEGPLDLSKNNLTDLVSRWLVGICYLSLFFLV